MSWKYKNTYPGKGNNYKENIPESFPSPAAVRPEQEVLTPAAAEQVNPGCFT